MDDDHRADTYTFGDSPAAADRLDQLAAVYAPATTDLLRRWAPDHPHRAIDLGCGPGHTTRLLHEVTGAGRTVGVERSPAHLERARATPVASVAYAAADVTTAPLPGAPADVVLARYLLTHLARPATVLSTWAGAVAPGGRLLVQETARLSSDHPVLARYYELVAAVQRHHGQDLGIGARLGSLATDAGLRVLAAMPRTLRPPARTMARLHLPNLREWRRDPFAAATFDAAELDRLEAQLTEVIATAPDDVTVEHLLGELVVAV